MHRSFVPDESSSSSRRISGGSDTAENVPQRIAAHPFAVNSRYLHAENDISLAVSEHDDTDSLENGGFEIEDPDINSSGFPSLTDTEAHPESRPYEIPEEDEPDVHGRKSSTEETVVDDDKSDSSPEETDSDFDYEYEEEDDGHFTGFILTDPNLINGTKIGEGASRIEDEDGSDELGQVTQFASIEQTLQKTQLGKWKDPSKQAVSMSLRAENESTGGRRRLASDLYRIMMQDNHQSGFNLEPKHEDSMDKWTIRLFKFDEDSALHEDLLIAGIDHVELEMSFPEQYPFEPPFVRVVRPRFKRQTGFVMNGAICSELLTKDGWNPINDIESVIVSIRSLLVVGNGRLESVADLSSQKRQELIAAALTKIGHSGNLSQTLKDDELDKTTLTRKRKYPDESASLNAGEYSAGEAHSAYQHLSEYHKKEGWDRTGWWSKKG